MRHPRLSLLHLLSLAFLLPTVLPAAEVIPRGDVFQPLFADPREIRSTANLYHLNAGQKDTTVGAVGFGEHWGLYRWGGPRPEDGWQFGITAGVFAQFDMDSVSKDLINADYLVGLPLSWRRKDSSFRFRVYHQSSHLGDEFLLGPLHPARVNLSYEAFELILSQEVGNFRVYAGGEWLFDRNPEDMKSLVGHDGLEYRFDFKSPTPGKRRKAQGVVAMDFRTSQQQGNGTGWDLKAGGEFGPVDKTDRATRRWSVTAEVYHGPSPYGQFFSERITYYGFGFQLGP